MAYHSAMDTRAKGNLTESIACDFLRARGYSIIERNYLKKWGELDIVAEKDGDLHFIEVKSDFHSAGHSGYRPEENVHNLKQRRLRRAISTYLVERKYGLDHPFYFHVISVSFNGRAGEPTIVLHENIVI